jgi:hypothetical protein
MPKRVDCNTWLNCWITSLKSPPNEREIALVVGLFAVGEYIVLGSCLGKVCNVMGENLVTSL